MSQAQHEHEVMAEQAIAFYAKVAKIQNELHAPKNQFNKFGNYSYRNCEDILEALKKVKGDLVVTVADDIIQLGDRFYIKATATITDGVNELSNTAFAREALTKKGMDDSQITGAASSYARKYALNGLFCIDDNKDADSMDNKVDKAAVDSINRLASSLGISGHLSPFNASSASDLSKGNANVLLARLNATAELMESVKTIKEAIASGDLYKAGEAWYELTDEEKKTLWVAPTKGGVFTTQERSVMQNELRKAYYGAVDQETVEQGIINEEGTKL